MAHKLVGDVKNFASLDHSDPVTPKTTDLDEALRGIAAGCSQSPPRAAVGHVGQSYLHEDEDDDHGPNEETETKSESEKSDHLGGRIQPIETLKRRIEMIKMDKEDAVTVKYFPIKLTHQPEGYDEYERGETSKEDHQGASEQAHDPGHRQCHTTITTELGANEEKEDTRERIVEHILKNYSLFETNREAYDINPRYANRGHLQSILIQKQNQQASDTHTPVKSHHQPPAARSRLKDQYTQYRENDLIGLQRDQQTRPGKRQQRVVTHKGLPETRNTNQQQAARDSSNSLKRGVSSLNELLKRPLEFVKLKGRYQQQQEQQITEGETNEEQYKVPTKQSIASSSSLYLLPAPDYTVHIATLVVKDIILAHQRARHKQAILRASQSSTNPASRLTKLFKTYSFRKSELEAIANPKLAKTATLDNHSLTSSYRSNYKVTTDRRRRKGPLKDNYEPTLDHSISKIRAKVNMPSGRAEKASIIDNKDGTVKISYEPKEVGAHEISLRYNDEPIDEGPIVFYVDAVGSSKKKITAYGTGLTHGSVGEQNKFTINTGGLGSAKLNVTVEGPSKTQVDLSDNKDGTITVSYLTLAPGEYKIKVSFDGKQVIGSPFSTEVSEEGRQRSRLNVGRGSEHMLDLKISEDDLKTLDAIIVTPCGLEEPAELKLLKNGQLGIIFTPREQGDHTVNVRRRGNHISGSPFRFDVLSRDIGDAKQVKVSGKGLKEGKANTENEIIINTKEAGYGGLSVALEGPGRSEIVNRDVIDGAIKISYKPYEPGQYSLVVKYADHVVPGSPFSIKVSGQGTNPQKESIRKFRKLVPVAEVNTECHFSFKQPGVSAYDLSAKIHSPQGNSEDASVKDKGDYIYQVSFVPKEVGLFALSIRNKDIHIAGSPFPFTVGPLLDSGPHKVRCGGPGLIKGAVNKPNEFDIYTREAGPGELNVIMEGPSKPELTYTDRKDGSCHVGYKVSQPGEYRVSVLFNDREVPESPFKTIIMPNTGDVSKIELGPMPPDNMIQLNKPYNLTVIMNGAKGNIEGKVKVPRGNTEDCFASPIDAENWGVRFIPREFGIYQVHIKCKGTHIPQSPVFVRVGHDNADPAAILVHGHGLKAATVNHAIDFTVETCNAGHSMLEVNIEGPSKVSMGCAELDEGYKINYTPLAPGDYIISIKYNGCHIGSSPFKVRATKQPGSKTVADAGSHEISTIAISTTDREAKQKVEHMPKFKSDASRVYCKGMGLKKAFAGKPNTFTANCSEAGFNMIYVSFLGPTRNTIHECSVKHMGGQIYEIKYICKDKGDAMLIVKYGDEQIPGSPFKLEVV